jgi:drug/metabolite transporter (DMT)-like permease
MSNQSGPIPPPITDEFAPTAIKPDRPPEGQDTLRGASWLMVGISIGVFNWSIVKLLGQQMPSIEIAWFRSMFGLIVIIPFVMRTGFGILRTKRPGLHLVRGINSSIILAMAYYALTHLPIAQVTSISFSRPLFLLVLAVVILHEKVHLHRALATVFGFIGVLIIVRPSTDMEPAMMAALGNAMLMAGGIVILKILARDDRTETMIFYVTAYQSLFLAIPAFIYWQTPTWDQLALLACIGASGTVMQTFMVRAYRAAEASALAPFDYTRLIFASLVGYFAFGEVVDNYTWFGAAILIVATFYIAQRERKIAQEATRGPSIDSAE